MIQFHSLILLFLSILSFVNVFLCQAKYINTDLDGNQKRRRTPYQSLLRYKNQRKIAYSFTNGINLSALKEALKILEKNTCLKFKYMKSIKKKNFGLHFLGYMTMRYPDNTPNYDEQLQKVFISNSSSKNVGYILQQILFTIGIIPQHQRYDRDSFIRFVETDNEYIIPLEDKYNSIYSLDEFKLWDTSYDFASITQFSSHYFNEVTSSVMTAKNPMYNKMMGQLYDLSFNDIKLLNLALCSYKCKKTIKCKNNGFQNPKKCSECRCPSGFTGKKCEKVAKSHRKCGKTKLKAEKFEKKLAYNGKGKCNYYITSPKDTKIDLFIEQIKTKPAQICFQKMGLEIKYRNDMGAAGICFCGLHRKINLISENNKILIQYNNKKCSEFKIYYKITEA